MQCEPPCHRGPAEPAGRKRRDGAPRGVAGPVRAGFTLVELLVVVAIVGALAGMLMPTLVTARDLTERSVCQSNIRLLQLANQLYQEAYGGYYAPGAPYMFATPGMDDYSKVNKVRWYGVRRGYQDPFSREGGPLSDFLTSHLVKGCPSFDDFDEGFEAGCGGYGYNNNFVGQYVVRLRSGAYKAAHGQWHLTGNRTDAFGQPSETVAFTDTAFGGPNGIIEYSFCESPKWPLHPRDPVVPSIHFRHLGRTNVVWLDTHVSSEAMGSSDEDFANPLIAGQAMSHRIGWFGPPTNKLFDCQ